MSRTGTKEAILQAAVKVAKTRGFSRLTRGLVAKEADVPPSLVTYYFSLAELESAVLEYAKTAGMLQLLGQALAIRHPSTPELDAKTKRRALLSL